MRLRRSKLASVRKAAILCDSRHTPLSVTLIDRRRVPVIVGNLSDGLDSRWKSGRQKVARFNASQLPWPSLFYSLSMELSAECLVTTASGMRLGCNKLGTTASCSRSGWNTIGRTILGRRDSTSREGTVGLRHIPLLTLVVEARKSLWLMLRSPMAQERNKEA